jgi:hypothetical protein
VYLYSRGVGKTIALRLQIDVIVSHFDIQDSWVLRLGSLLLSGVFSPGHLQDVAQ